MAAPTRILASFAGLLMLAGAEPATFPPQGQPPRDVASRFLEALAARRWADAARLLDLEAFGRVRDDFLSRVRRTPADRPLPSVEDLRRQDPGMPREVAEYQIRQMREAQQRLGDPTPYEFAGVKSQTELRRLSIEDAAARWLEARDPRWVIPRQLEAMNCDPPSPAELPTPRRRLIGTIAESDSVAYGLYREELQAGAGAPGEGDLVVIELKLRRGRWVIQPRGDLLPEVGLDLRECPSGR
jgi:hypothetical protein